jgi:hypothetical protein
VATAGSVMVAAARASRFNRSRSSGLPASDAGSDLSATLRCSRGRWRDTRRPCRRADGADDLELADAVAGAPPGALDLAVGQRSPRHVFGRPARADRETAQRVEGVQEPLGVGEQRRVVAALRRSHAGAPRRLVERAVEDALIWLQRCGVIARRLRAPV